MTYQLAEKMTGWFIRKGFLNQEDHEVYVYCIDSLLAQIFFYVALILVAGCLQLWPETLCYYFGFIPFRYTAGGYHAKTDAACTVITWAMYGISMFVVMHSYLLSDLWLSGVSFLLVLFATVVALCHEPLAHFHKPVSAIKKLQMRRWCLGFQGLFILVTWLLYLQHAYMYAFSLALGNGLAALFLLIAYYQKGGR